MGNSQAKEASATEKVSNPLVLDTESPYVRKILDARKQLTGLERVKQIFETEYAKNCTLSIIKYYFWLVKMAHFLLIISHQ